LKVSPDLKQTPAPTAEELEKLREFDPEGYWTGAGSPDRVDGAGKIQREGQKVKNPKGGAAHHCENCD